MSKTREKKTVMRGPMSREEAEVAFYEFASADSETKKIEADMEIKINKIRKANQDKLAELSEQRKEAFEKLQYFAEVNSDLFDKKKSLEMTHGKIGFRTGTPKLKLLKSFNWDRVVEKLEAMLPEFVRTKKEADKEALLANRENSDVAKYFERIGVEAIQDESFFVEPKTEEVTA